MSSSSLVEIRAALDRQTELKDGMGDGIQQSLRIVGKHIDDREPVA